MLVKKVVIDRANRLYQLPPEILSFVPEESKRVILKRTDLLDLASFQWPVEFTAHDTLSMASLKPASKERLNNLKEEIVAWMAATHQVKLSGTHEVFIGNGISSTLFHLALAFVDQGDLTFVPDIGIPLYRKVTIACGGEPVGYAISSKNGWQPNFARVNTQLGRVARLLFLNSPHNPTGSELGEKELAELIWTAGRENILIVNDAAYQAVSGRKPISLLAVQAGRKVSVELYSFSYQFGLPPMPFGFAVGNRDVIAGIRTASSLFPVRIPDYFVDLALRGMRQASSEGLKTARSLFQQTQAEASNLLSVLSLESEGEATIPFIWARIDRRSHAATLARLLYRRSRILVAPGTSFGEKGEGYLRFALTTGPKAYADAAARVQKRLKLLRAGGDE